MKILIISRLIFPALSPRAFRTTELAKELARQGHDVTVYAVLGKRDYSDFEKTTNIKIRNIGKMILGSSDSDGNYRYTLLDKILYHSLHRLIEYPDIELMFRIPVIIKNENNCDLLITIAHPHPIHWGAALAKTLYSYNQFPKVWISDCGDPYFKNKLDKRKIFYLQFIEKWWGRNTDYITIPIDEGKNGYYNQVHSKIQVIPQGFDFENVRTDTAFVKNNIPEFAYAGSIYPGQRDPCAFLTYLVSLKFDFKFIIYTNDQSFFTEFKVLLKHKLDLRPFIPREQLIFELSRMDFLINLTNPDSMQLPSKIIDYLLTTRPIMEVSLNFPQQEQSNFNEFIKGNFNNQLSGFDIQQFNITTIAQKFVSLYNNKVSDS